MANKSHKILLFLMVVFLTISCDPNRVFEQNVSIPGNKWISDNVVSFNVSVSDTVSAHNIYLNVRNTGKYKYSNLFLFVSTTAPTGNILKDTFEIELADKRGKWYGKGLGDVFSSQVPYKMNVRFPYRGIYNFKIEQAMRKDTLPEITNMGIRVELTE